MSLYNQTKAIDYVNEKLGFDPPKSRQWLKYQGIPMEKHGNLYYYRKKDLDQWMSRNDK
jgi:hypothetical protein